jgi:hypothetical protein
MRRPVEKMCETKIGRDEHHREQEHDRVEVDRAISALGRHDAARDHQHSAKQSRRWTIQRQDFELPAADENVRDSKDHARDKLPRPVTHMRPYAIASGLSK